MAAELFVSYGKTDEDRIAPLVSRLQRAGVSVWVDEQGVEGTAPRSLQIVEAIEECKVFLLPLTEDAVASDNIVREVALALECGKQIFPIYLDPVKLPNSLRYPLAGIQHIELFHGDPEEKFVAILQALIHQGITVAAPTGPTEAPASGVLHNLPAELTSFVGREREIAAVQGLLSSASILTLTGAGGCGKTRLALRVVANQTGEFPDGVWFVGLEALDHASRVEQSVASVLGLREEPGRPLLQTLTEFLRSKKLLLILDNCEHVVEACARLVATLARACPSLRIVATSREALGVGGERVFHVPSLPTPDPRAWSIAGSPAVGAGAAPSPELGAPDLSPSLSTQPEALLRYEAVQLFVDRCRSVSRTFELTPQNASAVAQVCHRLDGIPLALELAAARVRLLTVEQIDTRLDDRFRLLTGGSRAALPRQQTLRATIDWSYELLDEPERLLFRRLAVFAGGWTLEAVEAVCPSLEEGRDDGPPTRARRPGAAGLDPANSLDPDEILDLLGRLVDKSLVVVAETAISVRYRLSDTVREYGLERLQESGEQDPLRRSHLSCFRELAEQAEEALAGTEQSTWLERLEIEHDNLRAALGNAVAVGEALGGLRLGAALWRFWEIRGYPTEGRQRLEALLTAVDQARGAPSSHAASADEERDRDAARAKVLNAIGNLAHLQGDLTAACAMHEESLRIRRALEDLAGVATSLNNLGFVALDQSQYETARTLFAECLTICRELPDTPGIAAALGNLAILAQHRGEYDEARRLEEEALGMRRASGDRIGIAASLNNLGLIAHEQADAARARTLFQESLALQREIGNKQGIALALGNMGYVAECQGDFANARAQYEQCLTLLRELGDRHSVAHCLSNLGHVAACLEEYAPAAALQAESLAIQREVGDKRGAALSLVRLARSLRCQGEASAAEAHCRESLALAWELQDRVCLARILEELAADGTERQRARWAAELLGAAEALREAIATPHFPIEVAGYERDVAATRAALDEATFAAAWSTGRGRDLEQLVEDALQEVPPIG